MSVSVLPKDVRIFHGVFYKVCLYFLLLFPSFSISSGQFLAGWNEVGASPSADMGILRDEVRTAERGVQETREALREFNDEDWDPPWAQHDALKAAHKTALQTAIRRHEQYAEGVLCNERWNAGLVAIKSAVSAGTHILAYQSGSFEMINDLSSL